jgi:predicted Zn finger-like uncharacterized protein
MKFTCDRCDAQYMISDEKVGPNGVKVRCKKCSHVILVRRAEESAASTEAPAPVVAGPAPTGEGLEAELGQAFDNAFGGGPLGSELSSDTPAPGAAAPKADLDSTQAVSPEEAAKLAAGSAAPEPAATEWYVAIGQAQVGPLPLVEVRRKWEAGDIGPDSLVWRPGMGDWAALSGVSDLAAYLAPVPRGAAKPRPSQTPAPRSTFGAMPAASAAPAPQPARGADVAWKPTGASALAALASEELSSQPEAKPEPKPLVTAKSLMEGLPDGGGVDPTGAIPLQIKALEETGEQPAKSSVARGAEKLRKKRSSTRALVAIAGVLLLLVVGAGAGFVFKDQLLGAIGQAPPAPKPFPADKPTFAAGKPAAQPPPAEPAAGAGTSTAAATTAATPPPPADAKPAEPKAAETKPAEPKVAETKPEPKAAEPKPEPKAVVAAKEEKAKPEPRGAHARETREKKPEKAARVARADEAAPAPAPRKKGGDLLDFEGGGDAALDEALGKGGSGRSVYVPPAPGGGGGVPERVTDSQVNETIMTRVSALQQCLADKGTTNGGVLKMRWSISPEGAVQNLKCITPESANTPFASCVTGVLKGLRFPKTKEGRQDVTFPFKF